MQLLLKDDPVLAIDENGASTILDARRLPFALRKERVTFPEFVEWAVNRTLPIGRSFAKAILNSLRLSQNNRFAVCKACRGLSLADSYWIRQEGDEKRWQEINLFENPLALFMTELSLSGSNTHFMPPDNEMIYAYPFVGRLGIHTPELTTLGANAKGWIRHEEGLYLHKVGRYEIAADLILTALKIPHLPYRVSAGAEIDGYLTEERKEWLAGVGEIVVKSRLFTSAETAFVAFEELRIFCENHGLNPYAEARKIDRRAYLEMQVADYILNNDDRHEQNWGFFMDNASGKITGFCPLFDHDHAFARVGNIRSQTTDRPQSLETAAIAAQAELKLAMGDLLRLARPAYLTEEQWEKVRERAGRLE